MADDDSTRTGEPTVAELADRQAATESKVDELLGIVKNAIGTGGTATILARMEGRMHDYNRLKIEALRLSFTQVQGWANQLWNLSLADRREITGLPPKRADVILPGLEIYAGTMEVFGFAELRVSTRSLRFAVVMND